MRHESPGWETIHNVGEVSQLSNLEGDSTVHRVQGKDFDVVAKEYERLKDWMGDKLAKEILRNYYNDTELAKTFLINDPNPLHQEVVLGGNTYPMHYTVLSQGAALLEGEKSVSHKLIDKTPMASPVAFGQNFQAGHSLMDIAPESAKKNGFKTFETVPADAVQDDQKELYNNLEAHDQIVENCKALFAELSQKMDVHFAVSRMNIKPFLNTKDHRIDIIITDLAAGLQRYFEESPKLEPLTKAWDES